MSQKSRREEAEEPSLQLLRQLVRRAIAEVAAQVDPYNDVDPRRVVRHLLDLICEFEDLETRSELVFLALTVVVYDESHCHPCVFLAEDDIVYRREPPGLSEAERGRLLRGSTLLERRPWVGV